MSGDDTNKIIEELVDAEGPRKTDDFLEGAELGLVPTKSLDLGGVNSFSGMLEAMRDTSFGGRKLGEAADVLETMVRDPDCLVVGTFSGAASCATPPTRMCRPTFPPSRTPSWASA